MHTSTYVCEVTLLADKEVTVVYAMDEDPVATPAPTMSGLMGDANSDGRIDIIDALLIAQYYVGLPVIIDGNAADTNCNGTLEIVDALLVAKYYVGLVSGIYCV